MLKALIRNEQPKPHQPHENHIKANFHSHKMGMYDFPKTRKTSTSHYFYKQKVRDPNVFNAEHPTTSHW